MAKTGVISADGGNSIMLSTSDLVLGTAAAHEYGHSLGLRHPGSLRELGYGVYGQPGIMATTLNVVDNKFTVNPSAPLISMVIYDPITGEPRINNPLNKSQRVVLPTEVSRIYNGGRDGQEVKFGGISNIIFNGNGMPIRSKQ